MPLARDSSRDVDDDLGDDASFRSLLRDVARATPVRPDELRAAVARSDLVGRTVGDFRVLARLGAGGMGVVYRAHDARLGRFVALKVLAPRPLSEPSDATRDGSVHLAATESGRRELDVLLREARAAAAINHPNVAAVYAAGEADELSFIAMEYVQGVTLRALLARGPLAVDVALGYARQIAEGLAKAHERGLVHRDLKPDNVMVDEDGRIKILDFGLARPWSSGDVDGADGALPSRSGMAAAGTPAYMAPEQSRGERVGPRSDVFALGALLYEALAGRPPFGARGADRQTWDFVPVRPLRELRGDVPASVETIVARCLDPDPSRRYPSATAVVAAIDALHVTDARAHRVRRMVLAVGVAVAAGTIAGGVAWRTHAGHRSDAARAATPATTLRRLTANVRENPVADAALSPDGATLAYIDRGGLSLLPIGGRAEQVSFDLPGAAQLVTWFPDGDRLLVCTASSGASDEDLWVVSRGGRAAPRHLARGPFTGLAVSPDGARVAMAENDAVGWLPVDEPGEARPLAKKLGCFVSEVTWSPDGARVAYASLCFDSLADTAIETVATSGGAAPVLVVADPHLYSSFVRAAGVAWTASNEIVYPRTEWLPAEDGSNLWAVKVDPRSGAPLAPPRRVTDWAGVGAAALSATLAKDAPDRIAFLRFESQADVYVADVTAAGHALGPPRRLTMSDRNERPSAWSKDGRGVYFFSDASGNFDIYYQDASGGPARTFSADAAWETSSQLAPDGKNLLFWRFPAVPPEGPGEGVRPELVRRSVDGSGPAVRVLSSATLAHPAGAGRPAPWEVRMRCPKGTGTSCVVSERADDGALVFTSFDPERGREREVYRVAHPTAASTIWDVSPDGTRLAIPSDNGPIRIEPIAPGAQATHVTIPGCDPVTPAWAPDGNGLFVSVDCDAEDAPFRLYYAGLDGSVTLLWKDPGLYVLEAEPSPDGQRLAIAVKQTDDDVWMVEGARARSDLSR